MEARSGLEVFLEEPPAIVRGQRLGLLCNPGSVDRTLRLAVDLLAQGQQGRSDAGARLTRLFAPEHGLRGELQAGVQVPDAADPITGLPVTSLYGARHQPDPSHLDDVDVLVIDLMQVGVRFYTRLWIAAGCLEACAAAGKPVVVLDRPNPIGGEAIEGPLLAPEHQSIVGRAGWPIRHGLTLGEVLHLVNESERIGADLHVVRAEGWSRSAWWDETGLPWIMPSPNMPTLDTAAVYPGTCLLEAAQLSEGRGTTRPFELAGAPWIEPYRWVAALEERQLPGVRFRPLWFQPSAGRYAGQTCGGVQLHVTDRRSFPPVAAAIHLLDAARRLWPDAFGWRPPGQSGRWPIDRLYGSPELRERFAGGDDADAVIRTWDTTPFEAQRRRALLY